MQAWSRVMDEKPNGRAAGGRARAEKLTPERRKEIGRKAAAKRWDAAKATAVTDEPAEIAEGPGKGNREIADPNLPVAEWSGKLDLGGNEIDCYVLANGTRVLSSGSTTKAIAQ